MILSNFIKAMSNGLNYTKAKNTAGNIRATYIPNGTIGSYSFSVYDNQDTTPGDIAISYFGIALSSDTTIPTIDDYQFVNFYTYSDLTSVDYSLNDGPMQTILTQTVRNDGTENVVINSVGIFGRPRTASVIVLLTKTLLDTPVTVAPGEVKTITVTIDYNSFVENVNA